MNKRLFSSSEKQSIHRMYGGICARCGDQVAGNGHADHRIAHSKGGETSLANAQLLCAPCNLSKGDGAADFEPLFHVAKPALAMPLHRWQAECIEEQLNVIKEGGNSYFIAAGVGSGKTTVALATYLKGDFDLIICITPKSGIRGSWQADAQKMGINLRTITKPNDFLGNPGSGSQYSLPNGFVMNIGMVPSVMMDIKNYCQNFRVMVAFDEAHHFGEDMSWTDNVLEAFEDAKYRVGLSGTPYRADNKRIAFLRYKAKGNKSIATPQYVYPYERAFADGLVAPIVTRCVGGSVTKVDVQTGLKTCFDYDDGDYSDLTGLPDKLRMSERLRHSAVLSFDWQMAMIGAARRQLMEYRQDGKPWAGLIVCYTIEQAEELAGRIKAKYGDKCCKIFADADTEQAVAQFNSDYSFDWAISITKISEGITIPRLRVCALLTTVTTRGNLEQIRGRIARLHPWLGQLDQEGSFFIPSDPRLISYAEDSNKIMLHEVSWMAEEGREEIVKRYEDQMQNNAIPNHNEGDIFELVDGLKTKFKTDLKKNEIKAGEFMLYAKPRMDGAIIGEEFLSEAEYQAMIRDLAKKEVDHFTLMRAKAGGLDFLKSCEVR